MANTKNATRKTAEAGRRGDDVRSDCWVKITMADSGGVDLDLTTKVESMYGDATRELVHNALTALSVVHAKVEIADKGALPFVILARLSNSSRSFRSSAVSSLSSSLSMYSFGISRGISLEKPKFVTRS